MKILDSGTYVQYYVTEKGTIYHDVEIANYHGYRVFGKKPFKYTKTTTYIFCEQGIFVGFSSYTDEYLAERYKNHH
ncbi:MAG: hypothetical protein IKJ75_00665 [Clostridia bacterium]|nr:hypothetical protein [Clostridia bacterium]